MLDVVEGSSSDVESLSSSVSSMTEGIHCVTHFVGMLLFPVCVIDPQHHCVTHFIGMLPFPVCVIDQSDYDARVCMHIHVLYVSGNGDHKGSTCTCT